MNPYIYDTFKSDMQKASESFINHSDYYIKELTFSSLILTNNKKNICFELDGVNLVVSLVDLNDGNNIGIYELFMKENIMFKYPIDKEMNMKQIVWYRYLVKKLLDILLKDLKKYI